MLDTKMRIGAARLGPPQNASKLSSGLPHTSCICHKRYGGFLSEFSTYYKARTLPRRHSTHPIYLL